MLTIITPAAEEPISLDDAKAYLRVQITDDDDLITGLIKAARMYAENQTRQTFISTTYEYTWDSFSDQRLLPYPRFYTYGSDIGLGIHYSPVNQSLNQWNYGVVVPRGPVSAIVSVKYIDNDGNLTTLDPSKYTFTHNRLIPTYGNVFPPTRNQADAVTIRWTAGLWSSADSVADTIKIAMKLLISTWYESRVVSELPEVPLAVHTLLGSVASGEYA
jgi:hypothetical protein